jgi:hypothetical protein
LLSTGCMGRKEVLHAVSSHHVDSERMEMPMSSSAIVLPY